MLRKYINFLAFWLLILVSCNCVVGANLAERKKVSVNQLKTCFADPDMAYAPFVFWFWDRSLDAKLIADMTEEMCKQGMNPGYAQGRSGLPRDQWVTGKWFDCFSKATAVAEKNKCYIGYVDEYDCPSGQALGRVLEKHPELKAVSLRWTVLDIKGPSEVELPASFFTVIAKRAEPADSKGWPVKIERDSISLIGSGDRFSYSVPEGTWRIYTFNKAFHKGIGGGSVNYIDRRLPEVFIGLVHEKYAEYLKDELGKTVTGVFVDNEGDYGWKLAWSDDLEKEFKQKTSTDIRLIMPLMIDEDQQGCFAKARWDWYDAVSDIFCESFLGKVNDWVEDHDMYTISNLWESNWDLYKKYANLTFQAFATGDFFKAQRTVTMPGNDCLIDKPYQVYEFKETQSVCEFENRRFMSEILGVAGWQMTPITMKKTVNSIVAFGVNHIVPHGIGLNRQLNTIPYPPDWFNENPYWRYFHLWSDFARRASYVNSQGQLVPDVLLLNPMDSVWALYGGGVFDIGHDNYSIDYTGNQAALEKIEKVYYFAVNQLQDSRIEYLITDRYYLRKMKLERNGRLSYKGFEFRTVILPHMVILPLDVAEKILNFAKKGGYVYALGDLPNGSTDIGLNDPKIQTIMAELEKLPTFKKTDEGINGLLAENIAGLKSHIEFEKGEFKMLQQHRKIDGKDFFWLVNNTDSNQSCVLKVKNVSGRASIWDCETGKIKDVGSKIAGDEEKVEVSFGPYEAYWLVFDSAKSVESTVELPQLKTIVNLGGFWNVKVNVNDQPVAVGDDQKNIAPDSFIQKQGDNKILADWNQWGLGMFSGFVDYTKIFDYDGTEGEVVLDLGKVNYTAEVWINDKKVGEKIWPPFEFNITNYVKNGNNKVFVRIGNTLYNTMRQYEGNNKNQCLWGWIGVMEEEKRSGLFGPVVVKKR